MQPAMWFKLEVLLADLTYDARQRLDLIEKEKGVLVG
jgi:hypothetical protein